MVFIYDNCFSNTQCGSYTQQCLLQTGTIVLDGKHVAKIVQVPRPLQTAILHSGIQPEEKAYVQRCALQR